MASNRIRYEDTDKEGIVKSKRKFTSESSGIVFQVFLNLNDYTYEIKSMGNDNYIKGGMKINNLNVLKRKVKEHLVKLGVVFDSESRNRTFGLCSNGYTQEKHLKDN